VSGRVISIAGAKGSPGCSFLAVALARHLAAGNIPTLLLDADAEGGGVASLLDAGPVTSVVAPAGTTVEELTVRIEPRLWFAELSPQAEQPSNGLEIAGAARSRHQAVVVDLGHHAGPAQRQLSAASDWLLWVVVPDRSGLERADRAIAAGVLGAARVGIVLNRIRRGCLDRADDVLAGRHGVPVLARINENGREAERLSRGARTLPRWGLSRAIADLSRSVYPDASAGAPA
jgi:Mrp family chromosome partitioning ATPase